MASGQSEFGEFVAAALGLLRSNPPALPPLRWAQVSRGDKPGQLKFIRKERPNWYGLRGEAGISILKLPQTARFLARLQDDEPFRSALGKYIALPTLGSGRPVGDASDVALQLLIDYLQAVPGVRWRPAILPVIWTSALDYFDARKPDLGFRLIAPVQFMPVRREVAIGDGWRVRHLSLREMQEVVNIDPQISEVTVREFGPTRCSIFLERDLQLERIVAPDRPDWWRFQSTHWNDDVNEEAVFLRTFLSEEVTVPTYYVVRTSFPKECWHGLHTPLPWQARRPRWIDPPGAAAFRRYRRLRTRFLELRNTSGWSFTLTSMRRFAASWENAFRADILADIVAALERLLVGETQEVTYKLSVRTASLLGRTNQQRAAVAGAIREAYRYRSKVFHGGYVLDHPGELNGAARFAGKPLKGRDGNPFHDVNRVHQLIYELAGYYRQAVVELLTSGNLAVDWSQRGL